MSLAIYVGSLTRYFTGAWELDEPKLSARVSTNGTGAHPVAEDEEEDDDDFEEDGELDDVDPEEIHAEVLEWRAGLTHALSPHLQQPLDWNEEPDSPYFSGAPSADSLGSLMLWTAYAEHPSHKIPTRVVKKWYTDPIFKRSTAEGSNTLFPNLLYTCEWWLPCPIPGVMEVDFQDDEPFNLGSSLQLVEELAKLNSMTWKADMATLSRWLQNPATHRSSLEEHARYAVALFSDLAEKSVRHKLPMLLDA